MKRTDDMDLPLNGYRVLDVSQVMAGPFCTMLLGDMGADVIKIEPPGAGDQTRRAMGFKLKGNDSLGFIALNRNKRSVTLNLKSASGRRVFYKLVETADILVENNRPGVVERLKIDYNTLSQINPRLVYASISGFGQTGPWSKRPGFDLIAQAMSGVMAATGDNRSGPVKASVPVGDLGSSLFTLYGVLSALIGRDRTGRGQHIDSSLFESALSLSIWEAMEYWGTGRVPQRLGTANRMSAPYQAFAARDGTFVLGAANQKLWTSLCEAFGLQSLTEDPRFASNADRMRNLQELVPLLQARFSGHSVDECVEKLLLAGVPAAPLYDIGQALESEHASARQMRTKMMHPIEGEINQLGFPIRMSATPQKLRYPAPLLGEHNEEVLTELGLANEIQELRLQGAF